MLTTKQEKNVKKMPYIETKFEKSKDGKYLIHKTIITTIRPIGYYEAIVNEAKSGEEENAKVDVEMLSGEEINA